MSGFLALILLLQTEPVKVSTTTDMDPKPPYTGLEYVDIDVLARRYQVAWTSDTATGREILRGIGVSIVVAPSMQTALVNGEPQKLKRPVTLANGRVSVPVELARFLDGAAKPREFEPTPNGKQFSKKENAKKVLVGARIAIDPGHGGMHTGGQGSTGLLEKDINLSVSLRLQALLEEMGAEVIMTRTDDRHFSTDVSTDLDHRVNVVNRARPDLFMSVHTNFVNKPGPRGFEVWVPKNATASRLRASQELAETVRQEFVAAGVEDRGIKQDHTLHVLRETRCTAVLVELEFISNPEAERLLAQDSYRQRMAQALGDSIRRYLERKK